MFGLWEDARVPGVTLLLSTVAARINRKMKAPCSRFEVLVMKVWIKFMCSHRASTWAWKVFCYPPKSCFVSPHHPCSQESLHTFWFRLGSRHHSLPEISWILWSGNHTFMKRLYLLHTTFRADWCGASTEVMLSMCNVAFLDPDSCLPSVCGIEESCTRADGIDGIS